MARKLRTGFELPFSQSSGNTLLTQPFTFYDDYVFKGLSTGLLAISASTKYPSFTGTPSKSLNCYIYNSSLARTQRSSRGCMFGTIPTQILMLDLSQFTSGIFGNYWYKGFFQTTSNYQRVLCLNDGTNDFQAYIEWDGADHILKISNNTSSSDLGGGATATLPSPLTATTWYNVSFSVTSSGVITVTVNGTSVTYSTGTAYSSFTHCGLCNLGYNPNTIDDLSLNDGSGASDNSTPNSIRAYSSLDLASLNTNSGFSAVGGTTPQANIRDGDNSTRASASADLSYLDFSLPTLSGTGMSETAANFTKIEAINIYGRQIEATKTSSLLKAKITDTVAVVNREENLTLPLTVGNDSVTMFDDGSSDWVLANLDSGDMDFRVTFDKP